MRFEDWRVDDSRLDAEQRAIVSGRNINDSFVVQGSAGSGKTIMAVRKSVIFGSLSSRTCVVLVYTKALKLMLQNGLDYYKSQGINHNSKAVYAWAWQNRGMDLDGEVFRKKGNSQEIYLRDSNTISVFRRCDGETTMRYLELYGQYKERFAEMTNKERKLVEKEFSKLVSIDFADYVNGELYSTYGRRTSFFEKVTPTPNINLEDPNIESIPKAVIFTKTKPIVDYLIVDEAQDFSQRDTQGFIRDKSQSIVFFGDTLQQLFAHQGRSLDSLAQSNNFDIIELSRNYRLPKDIARVAEYIQTSERGRLLTRCQKGYNNEETPTFYLKEGDQDEQLQFIIDHCNNPLNSKDVGILVSSNRQVEEVVKFLIGNGQPCQFRYNKPLGGFDNSLSDFMNAEFGSELYNQIDTLNFQSNLPCVLTYHSAKGTQFDTVFIPFSNDNLFINGIKRNEFYVAITRASNQVFVLYQNEPTYLLNDVPKTYMTRK
jgi:hypothetical protein